MCKKVKQKKKKKDKKSIMYGKYFIFFKTTKI